MLESIFTTYIFWSSFCFSIGPFWLALMESAKTNSWGYLIKNYLIYQLITWCPQVIIITASVKFIGNLNPNLLTSLYFLGGGIIFWLCFSILKASLKKVKFQFHWKMMSAVSWTSPKIWTIVPIGALSSSYTQNFFLDTFLFYLLGFPLYLIGFAMWVVVGKQGAKISAQKFSYFTTFLLAVFGAYLIVKGFLTLL